MLVKTSKSRPVLKIDANSRLIILCRNSSFREKEVVF